MAKQNATCQKSDYSQKHHKNPNRAGYPGSDVQYVFHNVFLYKDMIFESGNYIKKSKLINTQYRKGLKKFIGFVLGCF
jgi:hypothetical protein